MINHFQVDVPVPILALDYRLPAVPETTRHYAYLRVGAEILSVEMLDWLESKKLMPREELGGILFYAHTGSGTTVHTDDGQPNAWALNCAFGDTVQMHWHKVNEATDTRDTDLRYTVYPEDSQVIETATIKTTVCRISVPHSSTNEGPGCWMLSLRMAPRDLPWPRVYKGFKS
jgi:hypothetical protein